MYHSSQPPGPIKLTSKVVLGIERWSDGCVTISLEAGGVGESFAEFVVNQATNMSNPQIMELASVALTRLESHEDAWLIYEVLASGGDQQGFTWTRGEDPFPD